jgi:hypothetical protein
VRAIAARIVDRQQEVLDRFELGLRSAGRALGEQLLGGPVPSRRVAVTAGERGHRNERESLAK